MTLHILAVGKKHEAWVFEGIIRYQRRLKTPFTPEWIFVTHSPSDGVAARQDESDRILSRLSAYDFIILLDERGKALDSPTFAAVLKDELDHSRKVLIIIGGAFGVTDKLRNRADLEWSLSPLVFPHQLVRLILTEQLYRAQQIMTGGPYHHE